SPCPALSSRLAPQDPEHTVPRTDFTQLGNGVIDGFYDSRRIQKRLGFLIPIPIPIEFEERHYADQATAEQANLNTHQPVPTC
ncbi:hypothetical protein, partial [Streptomyces sp. NPDC057910]|uniref:hypothetical protein n=1 Tax=Streptomyces sp. NPDC057910 TaxID=3346278 RepID=UPI0036E44423